MSFADRSRRWSRVGVVAVLSAGLLPVFGDVAGAGEADAARVNEGQRSEITIPDGPFEQSAPRTDVSVPGESRTPVPVPIPLLEAAPDPNAGRAEQIANAKPEPSPEVPSPVARDEVKLKVADGPLDEVSEVVTNSDGSRAVRSYSERRWFRDAKGDFRRIDVRLSPSTESGGDGVFVSSGDRISYRFEPSTTGVSVVTETGATVRFRPDTANVVAPVLSEDGRSVTYPEAWPGVDLAYSVSGGGLKEDVILKRRPDRSEFGFTVGDALLSPSFAEDADGRRTAVPDGGLSIEVDGKDPGLSILPPVAIGRDGLAVPSEVSKIAVVAGRADPRTGDQQLTLSADPAWLTGLGDEAFPLSLDPIVSVSGSGQWATMAQGAFGATGVTCTHPPGPCGVTIGRDTSGYLFRNHMGFNLSSLWATIAANPGIVVSSANIVNGSAAVQGSIREWYAYDDMPAGQELNWYALGVMSYMGATSLNTSGAGQIDFTTRFNQWRAQKAAGATKWNTPTLAFRGNEGATTTRLDLINTYIQVGFQNRAPVPVASAPSGEVAALPTSLTATASDPDGDPLSYKFQVCDWTNGANANCANSPGWQASPTIALSSFPKALKWNQQYVWYVTVSDGVAESVASTVFRATVPPPTVPAWRGGDDPYSGFKGGVNLVTGNYFASQTDVSVPSVGPALEIERSYNSLDDRVGLFGKGWSTLLDFRIDPTPSPLGPPLGMTVRRPDGRVEFYGRNSDGVTYEPPFGYASTFKQCTAAEAPCPTTDFQLKETDGTVYQFTASGLLSKVIDELGRELRIVWSGSTPQSIRSYVNSTSTTVIRSLTFTPITVSGATLIETVKTDTITLPSSEPAQGQLTWTYGYNGTNLERVNDPINPAPSTVRSTYEYAGVGQRMSRWRNPGNGLFTANTEIELNYQADGKVQWRRDGVGNQHTYNYVTTPLGPGETMRVTVTDPRSKTTVWGFDASKRLVRRINERGLTRTWVYDEVTGFLAQVVFEDAGHSETFVRNSAGLVTKLDAWQDGKQRISYFAYNAQNNIEKAANPRSADDSDTTYATVTAYDATGRKVISETRPGLAPTTYEWTSGTEAAVGGGVMPPGLLKKKIEPVAGTLAAPSNGTTTYAYDSKGNLRTVLDPLGKTTAYTYDQIGRELTRTETGTGIPTGSVWTTTYDKLSRPKTVLQPQVTNVVTATARRLRTDTFYDDNGNVDRIEQVAVAGGGATRVTKYTYDAADRKTSETVAFGTAEAATTSFLYDGNGNVTQTTDPLGRVFQTTFTDDNLPDVTSLLAYQPDMINSPLTSYTLQIRDLNYDNAGREILATDKGGTRQVATTYEFEGVKSKTLKNFVPRVGAPYDLTLVVNTFDQAGNVESKIEGNLVGPNPARKTTMVNDPAGRVTTEKLVNSSNNTERETRTTYDAAGHPTSVVREGDTATDRETRHTYSPTTGLLTTSTVENGTTDIVTSYLYDARGLRTQVTDPDGGITDTVFDQLGQETSVKAPSVPNETNGAAPVTGRPEPKTGYDAFGSVSHQRDARAAVTTHTFDAQGRETLVTYPSYTPPGGVAIVPTQSYTYDLVGNTTASTDRRGKASVFVFDKLNRVVQETVPGSASGTTAVSTTLYDVVGNPTTTVDAVGAVTTATYDLMDRVRTRTKAVRQPTPNPTKYLTTTFDYDTVGNQTWMSNPLGKVTTATFNAAGQQLTVTDPLNHTTQQVINAFGETVTTIDPTNRYSTASYDLAGRQVSVSNIGTGGTQPAQTTTMTYNQRGLRTATVSPEGRPTAVTWDAANRMTAVIVGSGIEEATTQMFYDAAGNNTRVRDGRGNDTIKTYQAWNLEQSRIEPAATVGQSAANRTWTTSYDGAGLVTKEQQPGGVVLNRTFDEAGRPLTEVGVGASGSRTFAYDVAGRTTYVSHPSAAISVTYDDRGLPLTVGGGSGSATFAWDDNGRLDVRADLAGTADFGYDDADRLIIETDPVTGGRHEYGYDDANRRTYTGSFNATNPSFANAAARWTGFDAYGRVDWDALVPDSNSSPATYLREYDFDGDGLLTRTTVAGTSSPSDAGSEFSAYNSRGELASIVSPAGVTTSFSYDKAGNRTGAGAVSFTYDSQNRLTSGGGKTYAWADRGVQTSVTSGGVSTSSTFDVFGQALTNGTVSMSYDGLGRIAARNGTGFVYSGTGLDPVSDGVFVTNRSVDGLAVSQKRVNGTEARWMVADQHGDTVALQIPGSGLVDVTVGFTPHGVKTGSTGTVSPSVGFQSDFTDPTSGEVWMGARHYRPDTATFTSRDSYSGRLDTPVSLNRYTYAHNNPLGMFDPDGHAPKQEDHNNFAGFYRPLIDSILNGSASDHQGVMRLAAGLADQYRASEYLKLVGLYGDAAGAVADYHASSVVDPVIAVGLRYIKAAWDQRPVSARSGTTSAGPCPNNGFGLCDPGLIHAIQRVSQADEAIYASCRGGNKTARTLCLNGGFLRESLPGGGLDAKPALLQFFTPANHYYEFPDGSIAPVVDVGHPTYLVVYDVVGNVLWGQLTKLYYPSARDDTILELTHCPVCGQSDPQDDIAVLAGRRNWQDLSAAFDSVIDRLLRDTDLDINQRNIWSTRLIRRDQVNLIR